MENADYEKAILWYSEALDIVKDMKSLYTNRALAFIKIGFFKKAIADCTRVLEYCECFEEGYVKSRELCFKAFLRRALALKERKEYKKALEDIE
jgi:tetratricopeptide (TPR) repeat protein